jgi:DNA (cytosine-5)-methyltransferase 1
MIYGSVCSGIESASVAWEPLGMTPAWFSEIEAFPSAVLAHHWPDVTNLGDMTTLSAKILRGDIKAPDILVGGTPCQAFSVAGNRQSLDDERGQLTLSYVEIANAIDHVRRRAGQPECVTCWENVPGVLSTKDNAFGCFLAALVGESETLEPAGEKWTNAGCVYGPERAAAWRILDAQYFGVAQRRRRVFVIASARAGFDPSAVLFESEGVRRDIAPSREAPPPVAALTANGVGTCGADDNQAQAQAGHLTVATLDASYGRLQGCSGQDMNHGHSHLVTCFHPTQDPISSSEISHAIGTGSSGGSASSAVAISGQETLTPWEQQGRRVQGVNGVSPTLMSNPNGGMKLEPVLAPCVAFAQNSRNELRLEGGDGQRTGALSASSSAKPGQGVPAIAGAGVVRRLTPIECERLQGFADDHTRIPWRNKQPENCRDGPRYKAIGNSKAVPVVRWIGERIQQEAARCLTS